jgi:hypothetical protein
MVLHPEASWGGLPTVVQKTKIYNLETGEFASTPPFKKKHLAGAILHYKSAREVKNVTINLVALSFPPKSNLRNYSRQMLFLKMAGC